MLRLVHIGDCHDHGLVVVRRVELLDEAIAGAETVGVCLELVGFDQVHDGGCIGVDGQTSGSATGRVSGSADAGGDDGLGAGRRSGDGLGVGAVDQLCVAQLGLHRIGDDRRGLSRSIVANAQASQQDECHDDTEVPLDGVHGSFSPMSRTVGKEYIESIT